MSKLIKLVPFVSNTKWYNITDLDMFHYLNYHYSNIDTEYKAKFILIVFVQIIQI